MDLDLRAVLRLQPSSLEATVELQNLTTATPKRDPKSRTIPSSSSLPKSAAGSSPRRSDAAKSNRPESPEAARNRSLPFVATYRDDFKLKINSLPLTIDVPIDLPPPFIGSNEKLQRPTPPPPTSVSTRLETLSYPNWERYVIQKVT